LRTYLMAKLNVEEIESRLWLMYRERLKADGRTTEKQIESYVTSDEEMHKARIDLIEAEVKKNRTSGIVDAIKARKESLISLGAHVRSELQGDPELRAQHREYRLGKQNQ